MMGNVRFIHFFSAIAVNLLLSCNYIPESFSRIGIINKVLAVSFNTNQYSIRSNDASGIITSVVDSIEFLNDFIEDTLFFSPIDSLEMPEPKPDDIVISRKGFSFVYNNDHKQSNWVAYMLCRARSEKVVERPKTKRFVIDPAVKTGTANHDDYTNSGFDRGHLAPCRDLQWSRETICTRRLTLSDRFRQGDLFAGRPNL